VDIYKLNKHDQTYEPQCTTQLMKKTQHKTHTLTKHANKTLFEQEQLIVWLDSVDRR